MTDMDPNGLLDLAEDLLNGTNGSSEAHVRTAVNRAYYSAFISAYCWLRNNGEVFGSRSIHSEVRKRLNKKDRKMATKLEMLHEKYRVPADYDPTIGAVNGHSAKEAIGIARPIVLKYTP
ncbi:MAG: HEPN domain-containing protein [Candidatus Syntropharchaeales archaeon]